MLGARYPASLIEDADVTWRTVIASTIFLVRLQEIRCRGEWRGQTCVVTHEDGLGLAMTPAKGGLGDGNPSTVDFLGGHGHVQKEGVQSFLVIKTLPSLNASPGASGKHGGKPARDLV